MTFDGQESSIHAGFKVLIDSDKPEFLPKLSAGQALWEVRYKICSISAGSRNRFGLQALDQR